MFGQTNTSPYSILGIGDIVNRTFDRSAGMGGAGISLESYRYIYDENPASLPYLSDHNLSMEVSGNLNIIQYKGNPLLNKSVTSSQFQIERFVMGVKVMPFWGLSLGLKQFSSSNYYFTQQQNIIGGIGSIPVTHKGSGGLNQVSLSNGFKIGNFSVGLNSSMLFGHMQDEKALLSQYSLGEQYNSTILQYYSHFYFEGGVQYHGKISPKWQIGVGAIASNKTELGGDTYYTLTQGDPSVSLPTNIISDSVVGKSYFNLPVMYGGGLSLTYDNKLTFAADYKQQSWSSVKNSNSGFDYSFQNSHQVSGGIEYTKRKNIPVQGSNNFVAFDKYFFQFGGYYGNEYLVMRGQQLKNTGITLGVGVNSFKTGLGYMFNFQIGSRGTTVNNLIKENYFQMGVTISYIDQWKRWRLP
ncbi:hypothetical protein A9P82_10495 [Arachidicoccus ginsenosidimutans]|nr:hypothetical protein A9P82_10495 [Arachidicoccus sp. BS20]